MTKANDDGLQALRLQHAQEQLGANGLQIAVLEQMWLALARELAAQGVLNAEALAQQLEAQAERVPDLPGWFYGLRQAATLLRRPSDDPCNLVQ